MAETAFQRKYRQEFIAGFEVHQSLLRDSVTTEADVKGNTAVFLVADSGSATATTRGANGMIPRRGDSNTQTNCTLVEINDLVAKTDFNIYASQGNQRRIMQMTSMAVVNRKIDEQIIDQLDTATVQVSATAATASHNMCVHAKTILGVNKVPFDGQIWAAITPAFEAYLLKSAEFANADYVTNKPLAETGTAWDDRPGFYRWMQVNWVVHPELTGVGTSSEKCYMYHRNAVGQAIDKERLDSRVGINEEQNYAWTRTSAYGGAKMLQTNGVVQMLHDGSGFAAAS